MKLTPNQVQIFVFANLTQEDCDLLVSHINSVPRVSLNNSTPYEIAILLIGEDDLKKVKIKKIDYDDVNLSIRLLKNNFIIKSKYIQIPRCILREVTSVLFFKIQTSRVFECKNLT